MLFYIFTKNSYEKAHVFLLSKTAWLNVNFCKFVLGSMKCLKSSIRFGQKFSDHFWSGNKLIQTPSYSQTSLRKSRFFVFFFALFLWPTLYTLIYIYIYLLYSYLLTRTMTGAYIKPYNRTFSRRIFLLLDIPSECRWF